MQGGNFFSGGESVFKVCDAFWAYMGIVPLLQPFQQMEKMLNTAPK